MQRNEVIKVNKHLWDHCDYYQIVFDDLRAGADPNYVVPNGIWKGWTPLMHAVFNRHDSIAHLLLENGADPNVAISPSNGWSFGIDLFENWGGWPLLGYAIKRGNQFLFERMLEKKADTSATMHTVGWNTDYNNLSLFHLAIECHVDSLYRTDSAGDSYDYDPNHPSEKILLQLLKLQANVNTNYRPPGKDCIVAPIARLFSNHSSFVVVSENIVEEFLKLGAKNAIVPFGPYSNMSAFSSSVKRNHVKAVKLFLESDTSIDLDKEFVWGLRGKIPIKEYIAKKASVEMQQVILANNRTNDTNKNMTQDGSKDQKASIAEIKLTNKEQSIEADSKSTISNISKTRLSAEIISSSSDKSPMDSASSADEKKKVSVSSYDSNEMFSAIANNDLNKLEEARQSGISLANIRDIQNNSLLHHAATIGAERSMLAFLVDAVACELNGVNSTQETPLYCAVRSNQPSVVNFLLERGADRTYQYRRGQERESIYSFALRTNKPLELIKMLLRNEEFPDKVCAGDRLPLINLAAQYGCSEAICYLVKERRVQINVADEKILSPLHQAVLADQEGTVVALLDAGAHFDADLPQHAELLNQATPAIRGRLNNHHTMQKTIRTQIDHLAYRIFLALFADVFEAAIKKKTPNEYPNMLAMIRLQMSQLPEMRQVLAKITVNNTADEKQQTANVHQLTMFINPRVIPPSKQFADAKKWWLKSNEKQTKKREQLGEDLKRSLCTFSLSSEDKIFWENISKKIVAKLDLAGKEISSKDLSSWIETVLSANSLVCAKLKPLAGQESKDETSLIESIFQELDFSIKENQEIPKNQREPFYKFRIQAGLDAWLHKHELVTDSRFKTAYRIALTVTEQLHQASITDHNLKYGMKAKKRGLAVTLIKEILLKNDRVWEEVLESKLTETYEQQLINQLVAVLKEDRVVIIAKTLLGNITRKIDRMEDFSTQHKAFRLYENDIKGILSQWLTGKGLGSGASNTQTFFSQGSSKTKSIADEKSVPVSLFEINSKEFIKAFLVKFDLVFGKFQSLDKGMVRSNLEAIDKLQAEAKDSKLLGALPDLTIMGGITVSCATIVMGLSELGVRLRDRQVAKLASTLVNLFHAHDPLERMQVIKEAAQFIAERYKCQIERLQHNGVVELASCAVSRALQYITDNNNLCENKPGFIDKAKAWISPKTPSRKEDFIGPFRAIVTGVLYGKAPEFDKTRLSTQNTKQADEKPWMATALLENTGILVVDAEAGIHRFYLPKNGPFSDTDNREPFYGYCLSTDEEATMRDYIPHPNSGATPRANVAVRK